MHLWKNKVAQKITFICQTEFFMAVDDGINLHTTLHLALQNAA